MSTTAQGLEQFGRSWEVIVSTSEGESITVSSSSFEPEALRCTFEICQYGYRAFWYADVVLYNLDGPTTQKILKSGDQVIVNAGYQQGVYGEIFNGKLFQPLWERENVVDFKLTLHCLIGRDLLSNNFVNFSQSAFASQTELVRQIAAQAFHQIDVKELDSSIQPNPLPRGQTFFGAPGKYFDNVADYNNMQWWLDDKGVSLGSLAKSDGAPAIVYTPETGIVGTPQQTQDGVSLRILLDSRVLIKYPPMTIKIDNSSIRLLKAQLGQLMSILDKDGEYIVAGVRHLGDTRGNDWYTEIIGCTSVAGKMSMLLGAQQQDLSAP
jgi:hypothetical protein